jgi:hypothetical protein
MTDCGTVLTNCGMSRSGVSVRVAPRVVSVRKPSPYGADCTLTSGKVFSGMPVVCAGAIPGAYRNNMATAAATGFLSNCGIGFFLLVCRRNRWLAFFPHPWPLSLEEEGKFEVPMQTGALAREYGRLAG